MFPISWICLIWLNIDIFSWRFFFCKCSCLCGLWWRETNCIFLLVVELIHIPELVVLLLVLSVNTKYPKSSPIYFWEAMIPCDIVCLLGDIWNDMMFTVLWNDINRSTSWWVINIYFNSIIFELGIIWGVDFNIGRV